VASELSAATLVDANVLIDIFTEDPVWFDWAGEQLARAADSGRLIVNAVIYAEASTRFTAIEEFEHALPSAVFGREPIPFAAAFLAGKCFVDYRRRGGTRRSPLPDFFIGAHAAVTGMRLLTRDPRRYRSYFRTLRLTAPA
jgi:predicted nucleic acid-binding protein